MSTWTFHEALRRAIAAGGSGVWVRAIEPMRVVETLTDLSGRAGYHLLHWAPGLGLRSLAQPEPALPSPEAIKPLDNDGIRRLASPARAEADPEDTAELADLPPTLLSALGGSLELALGVAVRLAGQPRGDASRDTVLAISHLDQAASTPILTLLQYLCAQRSEVVAAWANAHPALHGFPELPQARLEPNHTWLQVVPVCDPGATVPGLLAPVVRVLDRTLPDEAELHATLQSGVSYTDGVEAAVGDAENQQRLVDAARGLSPTLVGAALGLAHMAGSPMDALHISRIKAAETAKAAGLRFVESRSGFDALGGLEPLKDYCSRSLQRRPAVEAAQGRGCLLVGLPGTGKSAFAAALAHEAGLPQITLDLGAMLGSLVGQTESRLRHALGTIEAVGRCVLLLDEIEKVIGGGGEQDGGVNRRMLATLLTWMQEHHSGAYTVAACNRLGVLPPELTRAGRFDSVWFFDQPTAAQRRQIWDIHLARYEVENPKQKRPPDTLWTGAEVEACCRTATQLGVSLIKASVFVCPVLVTAKEEVAAARAWATGRCLDVATGKVYGKRAAAATGPAAPPATSVASTVAAGARPRRSG